MLNKFLNSHHNYIVLDKSFLQGCSDVNFQAFVNSGRCPVVTAELYVEVCTDENKMRSKKLLARLYNSPAYLIEHIGTLYNYEIENHRPSGPIIPSLLNQRKLNPRFNFDFDQEQMGQINDEKHYLEEESADAFGPIVKEILHRAPSLDNDKIRSIDYIRKVYGYLTTKKSTFPPSEILDERWALYRKVQMDLLASRDYAYSSKKKAHDSIDLRICIMGALVGALAVRDGKIKNYFKIICPTGEIIEK